MATRKLNTLEQKVFNLYPTNGARDTAKILGTEISAVKNAVRRINRCLNTTLKVSPEATSRNKSKHCAASRDYNATNRVDANDYINPDSVKAYALGLLWADGYLNNKSQSSRIVLEVVADDGAHFEFAFENWHKSKRSREGRREQLSYVTQGKMLFEFLAKNDYLEKSIKSPDKIMDHLPKHLHRYWLLGYFDGDGCMYFHKERKLRQVSFAGSFAQDWSCHVSLLADIGISGLKIKRRTQGAHKSSVLRFTNRDGVGKLFHYLYPNGYEFGLARKHRKFKEALGLT